MQSHEYDTMRRFEDYYWWYTSFRRILVQTTKNILKPTSPITLLDAGCGTGGNLAHLAKILRPSRLFAIDIHSSALQFTYSRNTRAALLQASVNQVPFQKNVFDIVTSFDVLCAQGINDFEVLQEFHRILKPGGFLLINLPAYEFLRGEHDHAVQTKHRYTALELSRKLKSAGFGLKRITYWNALLLPLLFLWRKKNAARKNSHVHKSDFRNLPSLVNNAFKLILQIEEGLLYFFNLPFGTSVLAVAEKPALDISQQN